MLALRFGQIAVVGTNRHVSPVIHFVMTSVSIRDLRNHGGEIIDRVEHGEAVRVTRDGLDAPGLVGSLMMAIEAWLATYLVVPGPPGYTSCHVQLNSSS